MLQFYIKNKQLKIKRMKFLVSMSLLLISSAFSFSPTAITRTNDAPLVRCLTQMNMYATVEEAIAEAQRICSMNPGSQECKVAWDIVEELEAADSHRDAAQIATPTMSNASPDLATLMDGFDILAQKIDDKMDQLTATANRLQELGADDPAVADMAVRAQEMKNIMAYVSHELRQRM